MKYTNSDRNYKLDKNDSIKVGRRILYRIICTKSFNNQDRTINKGDIGGYIESFDNLSENAWVYGSAKVFQNADVFGNAKIYGSAKVYGNALVFGSALVYGSAKVFQNAKVSGSISRICYTSNMIYRLTMTDNHILFGCENRTIDEWKKFLKSDEVIETKRNTKKFQIIMHQLESAIFMHEYLINNK